MKGERVLRRENYSYPLNRRMATITYINRKRDGICVNCGKVASMPGKVYCEACAKLNSEARKEIRRWYKQGKICWYCGQNTIFGDEDVCPECLVKKSASALRSIEKNYGSIGEYQKKRIKSLKDQGLCQDCGSREVVEGKTFCKKCLDKRKYRSRRYYARKTVGEIKRSERVSFGLCYICGEELDTDKKVCSKCYERLHYSTIGGLADGR